MDLNLLDLIQFTKLSKLLLVAPQYEHDGLQVNREAIGESSEDGG